MPPHPPPRGLRVEQFSEVFASESHRPAPVPEYGPPKLKKPPLAQRDALASVRKEPQEPQRKTVRPTQMRKEYPPLLRRLPLLPRPTTLEPQRGQPTPTGVGVPTSAWPPQTVDAPLPREGLVEHVGHKQQPLARRVPQTPRLEQWASRLTKHAKDAQKREPPHPRAAPPVYKSRHLKPTNRRTAEVPDQTLTVAQSCVYPLHRREHLRDPLDVPMRATLRVERTAEDDVPTPPLAAPPRRKYPKPKLARMALPPPPLPKPLPRA